MVRISFGFLSLLYFLVFSTILVGAVNFEDKENFHAKVNDIIYPKPKFAISNKRNLQSFESKKWSFNYWDNYKIIADNKNGIGNLGIKNSLFSSIGNLSTPDNLERIPQQLIYSNIISLPFPTAVSLIASGLIGFIVIKRKK